MGYRKILVPLDGSKLAEQVLKQVASIAEPKAHIHLIWVIGRDRLEIAAMTLGTTGRIFSPGREAPQTDTLDDSAAIDARQRYLETAGEPLSLQGYWVTSVVRTGTVVDTIISEALDGGYEAIAMATHGRTGLGRLVLGSVTQAVLAKTPCPVLILRSQQLVNNPISSDDALHPLPKGMSL